MTPLRDALPIVLLACACGASIRAEPEAGTARAVDARPVTPPAPAKDADDSATADPRAEALRARGGALAPGMHLAAERRSREGEVDLVHAEAQDECIRVAYDTRDPITAELTNSKGEVLARTPSPASSGVLPVAGPVCVRRGDAIAGVAVRGADAGAPAPVLWAAWAAP